MKRSHQKVACDTSIAKPHLGQLFSQEGGEASNKAGGSTHGSKLPNQPRVLNSTIPTLNGKRQHDSTFSGLHSNGSHRNETPKRFLCDVSLLESKLCKQKEATRLEGESQSSDNNVFQHLAMQVRRLIGRYPLKDEGSPPSLVTAMASATFKEEGTWWRRKEEESNVKRYGNKMLSHC